MDALASMVVDQPERANDASFKPRTSLLAALRKPNAGSLSSAESDASSSDSDLDAPPSSRPVASIEPGKQLKSADSHSEKEEEEDSDNDAAYERMKKRLAASKAKAEVQKDTERSNKKSTSPAAMNSEDEDEMPVRANGRRNNVRTLRSPSTVASPTRIARSPRSSPGLFVTPDASPAKTRTHATTGSESDEPSQAIHNADLEERVQRIRAERLAKAREERKLQMNTKAAARRLQQNSGSDTDDESGRRLTQQAKPTRKAGKKAMELMARDQQRISRNMQLTHQAKTKKRHTMKDLFSRLGYNAPDDRNAAAESLPTPDASSALASSDAEVNQIHDTPPTSPSRRIETLNKMTRKGESAPAEITAAAMTDSSLSAPSKIDKGKGRASEFQHLPAHPWTRKDSNLIVNSAEVEAKDSAEDAMIELSDSDDEVKASHTNSRFPVFDRIPLKKQQESSSLLHLRHLAHLTASKDSRKGPQSISLGEMHLSLHQKAREQAQKEKQERIADLKRRGIHIETEEEREKNQMEIEDMVAQFEKQRQEDLKLAKAERDEAKKNGETIDDLPSSDESDGDYVGSGDENANEAEADGKLEEEEAVELELSGSEEEDLDADSEDAEESNDLIADIADEDEEESANTVEEQIGEDADMEDEDLPAPARKRTSTRPRNVIVDEEDESDKEASLPASPTQPTTQDDTMAAFGFGNADAGVGLTQMFAGTMANLDSASQSAPQSGPLGAEQNSLDFLRGLPDTQPGANFSQNSEFMVPNSQSLFSPQKESQTGSDTRFSLGISQFMKTSPELSRTQMDELPEPTQDAGFSFSRSPAGLMPPSSTVETVMMSVAESPIKQMKGRLHRGRQIAAVELSDVEEDLRDIDAELSEEDDIQRPPKPRNAFAKLQKGAKKQKAMDDFNKKTSLAKDAVMDQAEESEDEYAGLGGASDDDSGVEDEDMKNMIEHGDVDVDERQIAAFYADKAKKEDEKNINELYKNVMNGGLRRRAGGRDGFDMSDSEDEEDVRLRKKRAEFQKMNRALLADERIGNIAKDQKKQAFFHTLADFADEGDYEFLDIPADLGVDGEQSQSQEEAKEGEGMDGITTIPDSQTADTGDIATTANPLKRKSPSNSQKENRPPPNLRRTAASDNLTRKPITLADVQHSVSELLEDPRIMVPDSQYSESEDDEDSPAPNAASRKPIVDRLSLSRASSMSEPGADGNLAFIAPARGNNAPGFRVPSLIRQATSNLSATSESRRSSGASTPTETVRRGGTGKSNIHAQAREAERRLMLEKKDVKRRDALKKKVSAGRKGGMRSVLGDLGGGFE
ncbi:MRC1-like domain-containing protein [Paraphoma chrysanthemicola]|uniref:MRC1-like domain-containing protein n=1 Tax=Paraphoma chrysanthemicola TaxID=798071 RepID=A0A8K0RE71_9PLEO|nr:MRC1-like domain-containing protein [Paraphoma chrysanthemicola]